MSESCFLKNNLRDMTRIDIIRLSLPIPLNEQPRLLKVTGYRIIGVQNGDFISQKKPRANVMLIRLWVRGLAGLALSEV